MTKYVPPFLRILEYEPGAFVVVSVVDEDQLTTLRENFPLQSRIELGVDKDMVIGLVNRDTLCSLYPTFEQGSRQWRGRYQALAKAFVAAYDDLLLACPEETGMHETWEAFHPKPAHQHPAG